MRKRPRPRRPLQTPVSEKWLLFDVGNTALTFQALDGNHFSEIFTVIHSDIPKKIIKLTSSGLIDVYTKIVIVSVVPKISHFLEKTFRDIGVCQILTAGKNLPVKFKHNYKNFNKLGNDRKVNIAGAIDLYGGPCLILDFGTALTVDLLSDKNVFKGGFIIPGPQIALQALSNKTALLPKNIRLPDKIEHFLGRDPSECMLNGILVGYSAMSSGLIRQFRDLYGKKLKIVATGGFARNLLPLNPGFDRVDPSHTLRSLVLIALKHTSKKAG